MKKLVLPLFVMGCVWGGAISVQAQFGAIYEPYTFKTLAGNPPGARDGAASEAKFRGPAGVAFDKAGNAYVADESNHIIRKVTPAAVVSTLAGSPENRGSADGQCSNARFDSPRGVATDSVGNVYVADSGNSTIRKVTPTGVVTTVAGVPGNSGSSDGSGTAARFSFPNGIAIDSANNIYVADTNNHTIRKITPAGVVSTIAGSAGNLGTADGTGSAARFNFPTGLAFDASGNLLVADESNHTVRKLTSTGQVTTIAGLPGNPGPEDGSVSSARLTHPYGITVDSTGNIYVPSAGSTIRKITPGGTVSTFAGLYAVRGSTDGQGSAARLNQPFGLATDSADNVYVADIDNSSVRRITPTGLVSTFAGSSSPGGADGTGDAARFFFPNGVAADNAGFIYVADTENNTIRKVTSSGEVSTLAGLAGVSGNVDGIGSNARFGRPVSVVVDSTGNVFVSEFLDIRKITPSGQVTTFAGNRNQPGSADGTGTQAQFGGYFGLAIDKSGNLFAADTSNHTIRKVTPAGAVTTIAGKPGTPGSVDGAAVDARFFNPGGIAVDAAGVLYVSDAGNRTIRRITASGVVSTLAGLAGAFGAADGMGSAARFGTPGSIAMDNTGNLFVSDGNNSNIRKITPAGVTTTIGGVAFAFGSADGIGSAARFAGPAGLSMNSSGKLFLADNGNHTIRVGSLLPVITSPLGAIAVQNEKFVYQFEAFQATSLAASNLPPGLTFDTTRSAIIGNATTIGVFPVTLSASNAAGTTTATLTLVVQDKPAAAPVIISSTSVTGRTQEPFKFQVVTLKTTPAAQLTATNCPCGLSADPIAGTISGIPTADGSTKVNLTVTDVNATATGAVQLTFTSDPVRPVITSSDRANLVPGAAFNYQIIAPTSDPSDPPVFSIFGTLPPGLSFDPQTGTISGVFGGNANESRAPNRPDFTGGVLGTLQLFGTNSHGTSTFQLLFLSKPTGAVNISTRTTVGGGDNVLIAGFIITGDATKAVIIRAIAPSLGINGVLQDPILELHNEAGSTVVNDNWRNNQEALIIDTKVPPTDDRESAIVAALDPGNYTAVVRGKDDTTGIAVVEVYDLGTAPLNQGTKANLAQISTRGHITRGDDVLIGGFIVDVLATKVILRAIGPSLTGQVAGALQDTTLELRDGSGSLVASNDDWRSTQQQQIIDTTVAPKDDRESAIVATLNPGPYTAIVRGKNDASGVGLVEVYSLK